MLLLGMSTRWPVPSEFREDMKRISGQMDYCMSVYHCGSHKCTGDIASVDSVAVRKLRPRRPTFRSVVVMLPYRPEGVQLELQRQERRKENEVLNTTASNAVGGCYRIICTHNTAASTI